VGRSDYAGPGPINFCNDPDATTGTKACERKEPERGVDGLYGGAVSDDDSGSLRYVQVKYAGSGLATGFNPGGITFGGVGSGTDVEHVQVYNAPRHGIGYFGGTVNSRRIVVTGSAMQLDIDHGYRGSLQYVIGVQGAGGGRSVNVASARPGLSPASDPIIGNFTPGSDPAFLSVLFDCAGGVLTRRGGVTDQEAVDADRNNRIATHTLEGFVNGPAEAAVPAAAVPQGNGFLESVDVDALIKAGADVNATNKDGRTPLRLASTWSGS